MALGMITSYVGEPIPIDQLTGERSRPSYARVLVEVDATKLMVRIFPMQLPNRNMHNQPIEFEYEPKIFTTCHKLGHGIENCKGKNPTQDTKNSREKSRSRVGKNFAKCETSKENVRGVEENPKFMNGSGYRNIAKQHLSTRKFLPFSRCRDEEGE